MDGSILTQQINIIFDRERILLKTKGKTWNINKNTDSIIYEHSDTLINLFVNLQDDKLKEMFIDYLLNTFTTDEEKVYTTQINSYEYEINFFSSTGALVFYTLLQLGFKD
jgi:CYTH domain-containing protein